MSDYAIARLAENAAPSGMMKTGWFVVKTSKFCNLRCGYCYEFLDLGDKTAMPSDQIEYIYHFIATTFTAARNRSRSNSIGMAANRWRWALIFVGEPLIGTLTSTTIRTSRSRTSCKPI